MCPAGTSPTLVKTTKENWKLQEPLQPRRSLQQPTPPLKSNRLVRTFAVPVPIWEFVTA
jgi:hypothetical protein